MTAPQIRVLCIDDHPLVREGIAALITRQPDMQVIAEASSGHDGIEQFRVHQPDVSLVDLRYRIAREAIGNAFRHSAAQLVDVEVLLAR